MTTLTYHMTLSLAAGSDYNSTIQPLEFQTNETYLTLRIPLVDDDILENTERFTVILTVAVDDINVALGPRNVTSVTILDNDGERFTYICDGNQSRLVIDFSVYWVSKKKPTFLYSLYVCNSLIPRLSCRVNILYPSKLRQPDTPVLLLQVQRSFAVCSRERTWERGYVCNCIILYACVALIRITSSCSRAICMTWWILSYLSTMYLAIVVVVIFRCDGTILRE